MKLRGIAAAVLVIAVAGCSADADIPAIEDEVAAGIEKQSEATGVTVDCPDSITWKAGEEFHCFADTDAEENVRVTVSMENDDGEWSWYVS